jgi:hypothetical protein
MPAEIEIQLDAEHAYPTDAESERTAIERGWTASFAVHVFDGKTIPRYVGEFTDQDEALEVALREADKPGVERVRLAECSAYLREQIAAEAAFEGRVG